MIWIQCSICQYLLTIRCSITPNWEQKETIEVQMVSSWLDGIEKENWSSSSLCEKCHARVLIHRRASCQSVGGQSGRCSAWPRKPRDKRNPAVSQLLSDVRAQRQLHRWHPDSVPGFIRPWAMPERGYSWRRSVPRELCLDRGRGGDVWPPLPHGDPFLSSPIKSLLSTQPSAGGGGGGGWEEDMLVICISLPVWWGQSTVCSFALRWIVAVNNFDGLL